MLKRTGFDGLMITRKAASPVTIVIEDEEIGIESANDLWGMNAEEVQEQKVIMITKSII